MDPTTADQLKREINQFVFLHANRKLALRLADGLASEIFDLFQQYDALAPVEANEELDRDSETWIPSR